MSRLVVFLLSIVWLSSAPPAHADLLTQTVDATEIAANLERTFSGTAIHLHSLGNGGNGTYYAANASSIKVPASITGVPGQRTYFSLPDESRTFLGRRYGYYVNNIRSNGVFIIAGPDSFTITITLASDGPALVATCLRTRAPYAPCDQITGQALPNVEWRDARIDIVAKPIVVSRSLALTIESVTIGGSFDVGRACEWPLIGNALCALVNRQSQRIRSRVEAEVKAALNVSDVQRATAAGVRDYIDTVLNEPLFGVRRVTMADGKIVFGLGLGR